MTRPIGWRIALTLAILIGSIAAYWWRGKSALAKSPTAPPNPSLSDIMKNGVKLGLDLRGGIHLVMQVKAEDANKAEAQGALDVVLEAAKKKGVSLGSGSLADATGFSIQLAENTEASKLKEVVDTSLAPRDWKVDQRGREWRVELQEAARQEIEGQVLRQALETVRNRIDALGVAEPTIQEQGKDRLIVQLPGVDDPGRVKEIIGTTGFLELKLVDERGGPYPTREAALQAYGGTVPADLEEVVGFTDDASSTTRVEQHYVLKRAAAVTGRDLKNARVTQDKFGSAAVEFFLKAEGAEKFGRVTGENIGKRLAIVLDSRVQSAPTINGQIRDQGIIEGNFTPERADALALVLRSGALPARMVILEERTVGPSLGLDSIKAGVLASMVGMLLVYVAMLIYYKLAGVNAVIALTLNAILLIGLMSWIDATLTLPGIAGFILTIGMAVDSNVLIFERIREELEAGKPAKAAIDLGFKRAFGTIVDTHVTTVAAALFLFQFGTGPVKGFAVTLVLGLAVSMFTAVFVSHLLFDLVYGRRERLETISI